MIRVVLGWVWKWRERERLRRHREAVLWAMALHPELFERLSEDERRRLFEGQ